MCDTIVVRVMRDYHYTEEELVKEFPNLSVNDAVIKLAQKDFRSEFISGEITPNKDDFSFCIKNKKHERK